MFRFSKTSKFLITSLLTFVFVVLNFQSTFNLISLGSAANASEASRNFDSLYTSAVVILRNAHSDKLLNISEGPLGPHVVWSPSGVEQNGDNTIVVIRKEGTNIVELMNRQTHKVLGVNRSGLIESKLEVQNSTYLFNQFQSFYVDYFPNGNVYFSSVAFPDKVIHLPYGGRNDYPNYTLYDKTNLANNLQCQFKVDLQGDGANTSFGEEPTVVLEAPIPELTYEETQPEQSLPKSILKEVSVEKQVDKLRTGAVIVLRNADQNQPVRVLNTLNGTPIFGAPAGNAINDDSTLVVVQKPNTNIYQFFNRRNGKVLSVSVGGQVGDWVEVWNRVPGFNPFQSFYIDTLSNGNMVLSPVAFPSLALNLPEGGRSTTYQHYTLWSKEGIESGLNRQFKVEVLGYGAETNVSIKQYDSTPKQIAINLKNSNLSPQSFNTQEALTKSFPSIGIPSISLKATLIDDKVIKDIWYDGGHEISHHTWWGYYIYHDKRATINLIRDLEQLQNIDQTLAALGITGFVKRIIPVNQMTIFIEGYLVLNRAWFLPEAISKANKCLNTTEQSYLRIHDTSFIDVSCD